MRPRLLNAIVINVCAGVAGLLGLMTTAQAYPTKPIRVIVPFSAGSATDVLARLVGAKMTETWGQQVIVDNRPGASGVIAAEAAAKAPADGHTLFFTSNTTQVANLALFAKLPYDPVKDFAPVAALATAANLLVVNPSLGVGNVKELIQLAKANPGKLSFAGGSSLSRVNGEMFKSMAGIDIVLVQYKSNPQGVTDLLSGQVSMMFTDTVTALPHVRAGKLKALGVGSAKRLGLLPEVATVAEAGVPGYELTGWLGVFAPAGTPAEVVDKLNTEIGRILGLPDIRERLAQQGLEPLVMSPGQLGALVRTDIPKWARIIKEAGIKPE
ncbi:MAG: hypothetical protein IOMNBAOH_00080 [Rhodocyclaceae bacterium]|jgi:tripartite-type tricarboxylate transporter receptor subunit TctC|nr:hypothetical protein [Rhodocyclaceae bacterium]